jgi:hypothetical protein
VLEATVVPVPRSNLDGLDLDHKASGATAAEDYSRMKGHR